MLNLLLHITLPAVYAVCIILLCTFFCSAWVEYFSNEFFFWLWTRRQNTHTLIDKHMEMKSSRRQGLQKVFTQCLLILWSTVCFTEFSSHLCLYINKKCMWINTHPHIKLCSQAWCLPLCKQTQKTCIPWQAKYWKTKSPTKNGRKHLRVWPLTPPLSDFKPVDMVYVCTVFTGRGKHACLCLYVCAPREYQHQKHHQCHNQNIQVSQ